MLQISAKVHPVHNCIRIVYKHVLIAGKTTDPALDPEQHVLSTMKTPAMVSKVAHFCSMCGPKFRSMKPRSSRVCGKDTEQVAADQAIEIKMLDNPLEGMRQKSQEFRHTGSELYHPQ